MRSIAKRFVVAVSATAERDCGSSRQVEFVSALIENLKLAFNANAAVVVDGDFGGHEAISVNKICCGVGQDCFQPVSPAKARTLAHTSYTANMKPIVTVRPVIRTIRDEASGEGSGATPKARANFFILD